MTSIWMRSAWSPTSFTSSARRARSAVRIEAPSLATGAILAGGRFTPAEAGDEHGVAPMPVGPQAHAVGRPVGAGDLCGLELGYAPQDRVARGVGLGPRERADAVDETAARAEQACSGRGDADLESSEARELVLARPPQQLGTPASRP